MEPIKQSDPRAAYRRVYFLCVDAAALQTRLQASDMSTFVVKISKNGGSGAASVAATPVQVDATNEKGLFYVELSTAEIDTPPNVTLKITNTGGTKTMEPREIVVPIKPAFFITVVNGLNVTSFTTDRTETTDNYWRDVYVSALDGVNAGQVKKVGAYTGSSKLFQLVSGFTATCGTGDHLEIIDR